MTIRTITKTTKKGMCFSKRYVNTVLGITTNDPEDLHEKFIRLDYITQKIKDIYGVVQ